MSLKNGSFSLTRYRVLDREKKLTMAELNAKLGSYQAKAIKLQNATQDLEYGWVLPDNPELDERDVSDLNWTLTDCLFEEGILLKIRVERRNVPTQLLNEVALQRWKASRTQENGPEPERILKKQVLEETKDELLRMTLPSLSFIEAYWKDQEDTIYLFSQGKMARECFEDLFRKSFGSHLNLTLIRVVPPLMGLDQNIEHNDAILEKIRRTLPTGVGEPELQE